MSTFLTSLTKFILAVLLFPVVIACAVEFKEHISFYRGQYDYYFLVGLLGFLLIFLFVYQVWGIYEFGQGVVGQMLSFTAPFNRLLAYCFPFYLIIIFLLFLISKKFFQFHHLDPYFVTFAGFALGMHILMTAQDLQNKETTPIKPTYLLTMSLVFIVNLILAVVFLDMVVGRTTVAAYLNDIIAESIHLYKISLNRIFFFR